MLIRASVVFLDFLPLFETFGSSTCRLRRTERSTRRHGNLLVYGSGIEWVQNNMSIMHLCVIQALKVPYRATGEVDKMQEIK